MATENINVVRAPWNTVVLAAFVAGAALPAGASGIGDGGPATRAVLSAPADVAVDGDGNLYVADSGHNRVRRVDAATGVIATVAGNGSPEISGDGGPATSAGVPVVAIALDRDGDLYVAGKDRIRRVNSTTRVIETIAGGGPPSADRGDGGSALEARLDPRDVAVDALGNVYVTDGSVPLGYCTGDLCWDSRVRRIDPLTGTIESVHRQLTNATYLSVDAAGRLLVTNNSYADCCTQSYLDMSTPRALAWRRVTASYCPTCIEDPPEGSPAVIWWPYHHTLTGNAIDGAGTIYVGHGNDGLQSGGMPTMIVRLAGGHVYQRYAGVAEDPGCSGDGGPATDARLARVEGLAADLFGTLYIADRDADRVRAIRPDGVIETVVGTPCP